MTRRLMLSLLMSDVCYKWIQFIFNITNLRDAQDRLANNRNVRRCQILKTVLINVTIFFLKLIKKNK